MAPSERPPPSEQDENEGSETQREGRESPRRLVERLLRDGVRKAVERGVEQITETPDNLRQFIQDLKLPREVASLMYQQIDETKNGLYRAVAKEIRDFLEQTNITEELVKALTTLSFEIKTEIRFIPNDYRHEGEKPMKPEVKASVRLNTHRDKEPKDEANKV
ncbi:MAG: hypothetical protein RMJ98_10935 [Myxococcales bacterium]|nr:hypothetical protein [Polyangiaceae bacterium]MDW8249801.1 hypothetical protein [Myxococcales bacterium]